MNNKIIETIVVCLLLLTGAAVSAELIAAASAAGEAFAPMSEVTIRMADCNNWYFLTARQRAAGAHNLEHFRNYGVKAPGYNNHVLRAIDKVMATAPDGGGYFVGLKANPPESPVGYELKLGSYPLIEPPRKSSYCSGSSYAVFIESLNDINPWYCKQMTAAQLEACRMQEPDGSRRNDDIKLWGYWNDDFWGIHHAMIDYTHTGKVILPNDARPGDFVKIMWSKTSGHFVVFLGWVNDGTGKPAAIRYWSSQTGTNGFGEQESNIAKIYSVMFVRLSSPDNITQFDPSYQVDVRDVDEAGYVLR